MSRPFIVVGDKTDHGGTVIQGDPTTDTHDKAIARVGDKVTCPKKGHGGITVIVTGDPTMIVSGQPVARHGDKCACGATLISSQAVTYVDDGDAGRALSRTMQNSVGRGRADGSQDADDEITQQFFTLVGENGAANPSYRYDLSLNGKLIAKGQSFDNGKTLTVDEPGEVNLVAWLVQKQ